MDMPESGAIRSERGPKDFQILRRLREHVAPQRPLDIELRRDEKDPDEWAARLTFRDAPDRWFRGNRLTIGLEEKWFPDEDPWNQRVRP